MAFGSLVSASPLKIVEALGCRDLGPFGWAYLCNCRLVLLLRLFGCCREELYTESGGAFHGMEILYWQRLQE